MLAAHAHTNTQTRIDHNVVTDTPQQTNAICSRQHRTSGPHANDDTDNRYRDAYACIRRHQALALAPVT